MGTPRGRRHTQTGCLPEPDQNSCKRYKRIQAQDKKNLPTVRFALHPPSRIHSLEVVSKDVETSEPCALGVECEIMQPLWKSGWPFLKKLNTKPLFNPAIPLLGMHTKELKVETSNKYLHTHGHSSSIAKGKMWNQPTDR